MTRVGYPSPGNMSRGISPGLGKKLGGTTLPPRPLEPLRAGAGGEITAFQRKLELIVRALGVTGVARAAGSATSTVSNWRKGVSPNLRQVQQLARGLEVPVCWLTDDARPVEEYEQLERIDDAGMVREEMRKFLAAED